MSPRKRDFEPAAVEESPELEDLRGEWLRSKRTYSDWQREARSKERKGAPRDVILRCKAYSYVPRKNEWEGFYKYCEEVLGYRDLYDKFHVPIAKLVTKRKSKYWMLQACRGSFKSSIANIGYVTWRIAEDYLRTGESSLRILIASEVLPVANKFVKQVKQVMSWNVAYKELFGDHSGEIGWTDRSITSKFRLNPNLAEPTVCPIGLGVDRSGFHFDIIVCDDLEAERSSASRDQIENVWDFYRLLHSLLEPKGELGIVSTRWHYADIYARILEANEKEDKSRRYETLIKPAIDTNGKLAFPTRFDKETLSHFRETQGSYIYSCQYLLNPVPDEDRTFKEEWIKYVTPELLRATERLRVFVGVDMAYTPQELVSRGEVRKADHTVIFTVGIDKDWNYILIDWFRERCTKRRAVQEFFRQYFDHKAAVIVQQKFDRMLIQDVVRDYAHEVAKMPYVEYISYPSRQSKQERIRTALQPLFERGGVYILPGMEWFKHELLDFPRAAYDDGCDALCNIVAFSHPPQALTPKTKESYWARRIKRLKAGKDPSGDEVTWENV